MQYLVERATLTEQRNTFPAASPGKRDGRLVAKDVIAELGLSEDTIRRDLRELAAMGLLLRVHGGALPASPTVASLGGTPLHGGGAEAAPRPSRAGLVEAGQTVFIDGGTTNLELVPHLPLDLRATIFSHSPVIAAASSSRIRPSR